MYTPIDNAKRAEAEGDPACDRLDLKLKRKNGEITVEAVPANLTADFEPPCSATDIESVCLLNPIVGLLAMACG